jgi:hypothetical protein
MISVGGGNFAASVMYYSQPLANYLSECKPVLFGIDTNAAAPYGGYIELMDSGDLGRTGSGMLHLTKLPNNRVAVIGIATNTIFIFVRTSTGAYYTNTGKLDKTIPASGTSIQRILPYRRGTYMCIPCPNRIIDLDLSATSLTATTLTHSFSTSPFAFTKNLIRNDGKMVLYSPMTSPSDSKAVVITG